MKNVIFSLLAIISVSLLTAQTSHVPLVYKVENTGANCELPAIQQAGQLPSVTKLPDPFAWSDGSGRIENFSEWACRRAEIKAEIEYYELGGRPALPKDIKATYEDGTLTVIINDNGQTLTLTSKLVIPEGKGPFPVIIGMNRGTGSLPVDIFTDCIQVPYMHNQVATYGMGGKNLEAPFFKMYPDYSHVGDYAAWSWGISRLIDGLELVQSKINANLERIAISGCSYAGKMALFGGALDERIALTIAQESGGGGVTAWRISDQLGHVEKIATTNYSWFMPRLKEQFNGQPNKLPYDHHELIAMIAPRAVLVLGNPDYEWLADESGYISTRAAMEVWKAMGIEDRIGFDFAAGHPHCAVNDSQRDAVLRFTDKFLRGKEDVNTLIRYAPKFENVDYLSWDRAWEGHKLQMGK